MSEIAVEVGEATDAIAPPEQIPDLHNLRFDFDGEFASAQEALAARAGTAADWEELSESPEMAAYRAALAVDSMKVDSLRAPLLSRAMALPRLPNIDRLSLRADANA